MADILPYFLTVVWYSAIIWILGYEFGKKRGKEIHNHYNSDKAYFNVMPGATLTANNLTNEKVD